MFWSQKYYFLEICQNFYPYYCIFATKYLISPHKACAYRGTPYLCVVIKRVVATLYDYSKAGSLNWFMPKYC